MLAAYCRSRCRVRLGDEDKEAILDLDSDLAEMGFEVVVNTRDRQIPEGHDVAQLHREQGAGRHSAYRRL